MSQTALEFLAAKQMPESVLKEMDASKARQVARAMGWVAPPVEATLVSYTPQSGAKKEGQYLNLSVGRSKPGMFRICDGKELTDEARTILAEVANQVADLLG